MCCKAHSRLPCPACMRWHPPVMTKEQHRELFYNAALQSTASQPSLATAMAQASASARMLVPKDRHRASQEEGVLMHLLEGGIDPALAGLPEPRLVALGQRVVDVKNGELHKHVSHNVLPPVLHEERRGLTCATRDWQIVHPGQ